MDRESHDAHRDQARKRHNAEFVKRLQARRPDAKKRVEDRVTELSHGAVEFDLETTAARAENEAAGGPSSTMIETVEETIVFEERPVLFVKNDWVDTENVTKKGPEAEDLVKGLDLSRGTIQPMVPLIGRIDVAGFPGTDYVGTGWFVDSDIVVTNRHVASLIARWDGRQYAFSRGVAGRALAPSLSTLHEFDDLARDEARAFAVSEVLYIEPERGPHDIAFLRVARRTDGARPFRVPIAPGDAPGDLPVVVVGYPARAPRSVIPNQALMRELYRERFDVKRAAPGYTMGDERGVGRHDCTTLGGNSGSVVLDLKTGEAIGLHFAGLYQETNYAVRASVLSDYVNTKRWARPPSIETGSARKAPAAIQIAAPAAGSVTVTIPLTITVALGQPVAASPAPGGVGSAPSNALDAEAAARAFWDRRPEGVVAARVGFLEDGGRIGDTPYISASVAASDVARAEARGPAAFQGFEVRYEPANAAEQIEAMPAFESVETIAYDDGARAGGAFSFGEVNEDMSVRAHVGPEYSWEELNAFLSGARTSLVASIYEFHAPHIKDAIEARLKNQVALTLVMDNATFLKVKDENLEFDRVEVFAAWKKKFKDRFERIVAPEGVAGLISDSYHIKVTVRDDDAFWLSSGNWKKGSSQPVISEEQRANASEEDLPGNREWHVVVRNKTLAGRFRSHILQDFKRSSELGGGPLPKSKEAPDIFVDIPLDETIVLERRPPNRVLEPRDFSGTIRVKALLTPDQEGAVYSEAVLDLIRSARKSLLFQIPYIGMPSKPGDDRGYIDELIEALTEKLKTLDDARVILRQGGSRFSAPAHAAWHFKSKGVDIGERLRLIDDHHTKGMIADGRRVLLGSHNWSKPGVTLNRDASLIFAHEGLAEYFTEAFEIDWARANPVSPKRHMPKDFVVREAAGAAPPPGFKRVRLSDLLKEED